MKYCSIFHGRVIVMAIGNRRPDLSPNCLSSLHVSADDTGRQRVNYDTCIKEVAMLWLSVLLVGTHQDNMSV